MTISRTHKTKNYTIIDNRILYDKNLSWKAKSILFYALAQADTWQFYKSEMMKHSADKETALDNGLKELKKFGYLKISRSRDKKGKFGDYIWNWYETPQIDDNVEDNSKKEYLNPENPIQVKPYIGKSSTNNTKGNNTKNIYSRKSKTSDNTQGLEEEEEISHDKKRTLKEIKKSEAYEDALKLAEFLKSYILEWKHKLSKRTDTSKWALDIEKLISLDGYTREEINDVMHWVNHQEANEKGFAWRDNILSGRSLRNHFDDLHGRYLTFIEKQRRS